MASKLLATLKTIFVQKFHVWVYCKKAEHPLSLHVVAWCYYDLKFNRTQQPRSNDIFRREKNREAILSYGRMQSSFRLELHTCAMVETDVVSHVRLVCAQTILIRFFTNKLRMIHSLMTIIYSICLFLPSLLSIFMIFIGLATRPTNNPNNPPSCTAHHLWFWSKSEFIYRPLRILWLICFLSLVKCMQYALVRALHFKNCIVCVCRV